MKKLILCALMSGALAIHPANAFNPQPDPPGFGLIGITPNETLRLNVSNITDAGPRALPPDPCDVVVTFVDSAGHQILPAVQKTLTPGASTSIDLNGADLAPVVTTAAVVNGPTRVEVRPVIEIAPNPTTNGTPFLLPPGPCVSTVELIDNQTGRTFLTSGPQKPGSIFAFNPQPDPPGDLTFGLAGITPGQTIRLTAVNIVGPDRAFTPPDPCIVTLSLVDIDGKVVLSSAPTTLNPGQSTALDLPLPPEVNLPDATNASAPPSQLQLRGVVTIRGVSRQEPPDPCIVSLEVFDSVTGRTSALLSPQRVLLANTPGT